MKHLISILLIFCSFVSYSQIKMCGEYLADFSLHGEYLFFENDSTFQYRRWACSAGFNGKGKYKVDKNTLTLNFVKFRDTINTLNDIIVDTSNNTINTVDFYFNVLNEETQEKLVGTTVLLKYKGLGTQIKKEGLAKIKEIEKNLLCTIEFKYVGLESKIITIIADNSKVFTVYLKEKGVYFIEAGTKMEYSLEFDKSIDDNIFLINKENFYTLKHIDK